MNAALIKNRLKGRKTYDNIRNRASDYAYKFLNMRDLDDTGKSEENETIFYVCRLMPENAEKCPDGCRILSLSQIEITQETEEERAKSVSVLGSESYDNPEKATGPAVIKELLDYINQPEILAQLSDEVVNAVARMEPYIKIMYPSIWYVEEYLYEDESTGRKYKRYRPADPDDVEPTGFVWNVTAETLVDRILALEKELRDAEEYPMSHPKHGRNLRFRKNYNTYQLDIDLRPSPIDPRASDLLATKQYPAMNKMGKKHAKTAEQVIALVQKAWWWPEVAEVTGIEFED